MSKFNIGDRVMMIENGEIRKGVVNRVFDSLSVMIVEFDDGNIEKVAVNRVVFEPKAEVKQEAEIREEKKSTLIEKSEITITPSEFTRIASRVAAECSRGDAIVGLAFCGFAVQLHKTLFMTEADNA